MPAKDSSLHGGRPRLGFGTLLCPTTGAIFRMIFESINEAEGSPGTGLMPIPLHLRQRQSLPAAGSND